MVNAAVLTTYRTQLRALRIAVAEHFDPHKISITVIVLGIDESQLLFFKTLLISENTEWFRKKTAPSFAYDTVLFEPFAIETHRLL